MIPAKASIINYYLNHSYIVLATVITVVNYDCKTFMVQATVLRRKKHFLFNLDETENAIMPKESIKEDILPSSGTFFQEKLKKKFCCQVSKIS